MHKFSYYFLTFLLAFKLMSPVAAFAITPTPGVNPDCIKSDLGCVPTNPIDFVAQYYKFGLSLIGGVAVLFIIFGSYIILTSRGNPQQLNNGKSYIAYAIIGLLLAIFGYVFTEVITRDVLRLPGMG